MLPSVFLASTAATLASAHSVLTYPGWRGNNLHTNEAWPYGMQWEYPCGGIKLTQNRTYWPTTGGAVAFQPGWFQGHQSALLYINMGVGTDAPDGGPLNMSNVMMPQVQLLGPTNAPYPGTVCFPQVQLPTNWTMNPGDNATIQVVEIAQHGAALYSCVDITFAAPGDPRIPEVNSSNCFNSTDLGFASTYSIVTKPIGTAANMNVSGALSLRPSMMAWVGYLPLVAGAAWLLI